MTYPNYNIIVIRWGLGSKLNNESTYDCIILSYTIIIQRYSREWDGCSPRQKGSVGLCMNESLLPGHDSTCLHSHDTYARNIILYCNNYNQV